LGKFFGACDQDINDGRTTDIYFKRTMQVLKERNLLVVNTLSEFTVASLPDSWPWCVFCGSEEVIRLFKGKDVDLTGITEVMLRLPELRWDLGSGHEAGRCVL